MIEANIAYVPGWESTATRALQLGYKAVVVGVTCKGDVTQLETLLPTRDVLRNSLLNYIKVCFSFHFIVTDYEFLCCLCLFISNMTLNNDVFINLKRMTESLFHIK